MRDAAACCGCPWRWLAAVSLGDSRGMAATLGAVRDDWQWAWLKYSACGHANVGGMQFYSGRCTQRTGARRSVPLGRSRVLERIP